jgi:hypothetical protein
MATKKDGDVLDVVVDGGFLRESLNRNSTQIKKDRAEIIHEDLQMVFSRSVEDTAKDLKRAKREITNMYDFSPTNSQSLVLVSDLDGELINQKDTASRLKVRELTILLEVKQEGYKTLFGKELVLNV